MTTALITIIVSLLTGSLGYYIRYKIDKTKELNSSVTEERRVHYQKFIDMTVDLLEDQTKTKNLIKKIYDFSKKYFAYSSPKVVIAIGDYFQFLYNEFDELENNKSNTIKQFELLSKIIFEMRKDLGLSNKKLGKNGERLFRIFITDYHDFFKK